MRKELTDELALLSNVGAGLVRQFANINHAFLLDVVLGHAVSKVFDLSLSNRCRWSIQPEFLVESEEHRRGAVLAVSPQAGHDAVGK